VKYPWTAYQPALDSLIASVFMASTLNGECSLFLITITMSATGQKWTLRSYAKVAHCEGKGMNRPIIKRLSQITRKSYREGQYEKESIKPL